MIGPGITDLVLYAVCTECAFLRVFSTRSQDRDVLEACPACGGELIVRKKADRFPPTYVSRVSLELLGTPELDSPADR